MCFNCTNLIQKRRKFGKNVPFSLESTWNDAVRRNGKWRMLYEGDEQLFIIIVKRIKVKLVLSTVI